jgi:hypothetical protein
MCAERDGSYLITARAITKTAARLPTANLPEDLNQSP